MVVSLCIQLIQSCIIVYENNLSANIMPHTQGEIMARNGSSCFMGPHLARTISVPQYLISNLNFAKDTVHANELYYVKKSSSFKRNMCIQTRLVQPENTCGTLWSCTSTSFATPVFVATCTIALQFNSHFMTLHTFTTWSYLKIMSPVILAIDLGPTAQNQHFFCC